MPTFTTDDGCTLHYQLREPDQQGPTVVFLNGMTQSTAHWKSQSKAFRDSGYRVLTYDARGQGKSELGDRDLSLELHAEDLVALLSALDIDRAHLVGFSHGARVALACASIYPERVDRLVLCSATAEPTALARTIVRSWHEVLIRGGLETLSWSSLPTILGDDFLRKNERILGGIVRAAVERNSEEGVRALLEAMMDYPDLTDMADGIEPDTLVISANQDLLVTHAGAKRLAELCGGTHRHIEGVAHTIPIEAPQEFHTLVHEFLTTS